MDPQQDNAQHDTDQRLTELEIKASYSDDLLEQLNLIIYRQQQQIDALVHEVQQMLAIGRALMTNPHLLILDEATEGLAPLVREEIWQCLATLRTQGQTILVIDKYVQRLVRLADRHTIIERGQVVWQGSSQQLGADPSLWQRYIGV